MHPHQQTRDEEDFSLEVTSPSITDPIQDKRQFNKNIGRILQLKTDAGSFEGKLTEIVDDQLVLQWKVREPKPVGKGKVTVEKREVFPIENISEAKVKIIF